MKLKNIPAFLVAGLALAAASIASASVSIGSAAPDFTLTDIDGNTHSLSDFRGKTVVHDRKSLSALRGVGPEFEAGSGDFHARMLPDRALRVNLALFCGSGRAPNHKRAGSERGRAGNASLTGAPRRCRGSQFCANTGSWS